MSNKRYWKIYSIWTHRELISRSFHHSRLEILPLSLTLHIYLLFAFPFTVLTLRWWLNEANESEWEGERKVITIFRGVETRYFLSQLQRPTNWLIETFRTKSFFFGSSWLTDWVFFYLIHKTINVLVFYFSTFTHILFHSILSFAAAATVIRNNFKRNKKTDSFCRLIVICLFHSLLVSCLEKFFSPSSYSCCEKERMKKNVNKLEFTAKLKPVWKKINTENLYPKLRN